MNNFKNKYQRDVSDNPIVANDDWFHLLLFSKPFIVNIGGKKTIHVLSLNDCRRIKCTLEFTQCLIHRT